MLPEFTATVLGHRDGHGFAQREDGGADIFLSPNEMRSVLHGDVVKVRVARLDRKGRPEGRILELLERPKRPIIGRLLNEGGVWVMAPEDKRMGQDILISSKSPKELQAALDKVVMVELTGKAALFTQPIGRIIEVLGDADDPGMEIEIAVRKYDVPHIFSETCLQQAKALPDKVLAADRRGRIDLTDVPLITIDGEDARDFDDAVYCEPAVLDGGDKSRSKKPAPNGWRLVVAIADVSHYVQTGSSIDVDAYERATSVYFPRRVIPMLPEKLSNGLCSLNPQVERLCMVCDMLITHQGDVHAYDFYPAVMFSHARMTYTDVAAIVNNTRGPESAKYQALVPHLIHLHGVYESLMAARAQRGAVDFETVETQIVCDENGRIEQIVPRVRNVAHRMIEEAMLAANVCSADFIAQSKQAGLFRVHEGPTPEKKELLRNYLKAIGVNATLSAEPLPHEFQAIAHATKDRADAAQIHTMLLRSMQQAIYTPVNSGHFGLAFEAYTHFTSPIRRYPDLLVHRVIKSALSKKHYSLPQLPTPTQAHTKMGKFLARKKPQTEATQFAPPAEEKLNKKQLAERQSWEAAGLHCSACERRADEASRDVQAWLKCKYMKAHLGEEFYGIVSTVTGFGLFVTLDAMYVEGLVHITELGGDYYRFDEARQELRGERTGIRYTAGMRLQVQVSGVDLDARKIDFRILPESVDAVRSKVSVALKLEKSARDIEKEKRVEAQKVLRAVKKSASTKTGKNGRGAKTSAKNAARGAAHPKLTKQHHK